MPPGMTIVKVLLLTEQRLSAFHGRMARRHQWLHAFPTNKSICWHQWILMSNVRRCNEEKWIWYWRKRICFVLLVFVEQSAAGSDNGLLPEGKNNFCGAKHCIAAAAVCNPSNKWLKNHQPEFPRFGPCAFWIQRNRHDPKLSIDSPFECQILLPWHQ